MRLAAVLGLLLAACTPEVPPSRRPPPPPLPLPRAERYGILRDLVLFLRRADDGGSFFLDRYETTRADWHTWQRAHGLEAPPIPKLEDFTAQVQLRHPITGVSMIAARRFAAWRFCRLQRLDEWEHARTAGGRYPYPWGDNWFAGTWCNSHDLGLDRTTPVGTFPASDNGLGACDLVGNVREWTETAPVPPLYQSPVTDVVVHYMPGECQARRALGLAAWQPPWLPLPTVWMVAAAPVSVERVVVGGDYRSQVPVRDQRKKEPYPTVAWWRDRDRQGPVPRVADPMPNPSVMDPTEYDDLTGLRLATDPESLLVALLREPAPATAQEAELLRWFLARPGHLQALRNAWPRARRRVDRPGPLVALVAAGLEPPPKAERDR